MIALKNATLIDGIGAQPILNANVIIEGSKIVAAGAGTAVPEGADAVYDLKGKTVLPGLIDLHVHFGGTDGFDYPGICGRHDTYDFLKNRMDCLKWGVTAIRSTGDFAPDIFDFRDEVNRGQHISPRIVAAGRMIQARGGHPVYTVFGSNQAIIDNACVVVDDSTDLAREVKALADAGAEWIKVFISEVNKMDYPAPIPRIPPEKIRQIVELAHQSGKPCMVHVDSISHMREAAEFGADSIEHVFCVGATDIEIDDTLIEMLVKKNICVVPTVYSIRAHEAPDGPMPLVYEKLITQVNKLIKAGVYIGVGTDASIPFVPLGDSMHEEMSELVKCGMTPIDVIKAATQGNAKLLKKEKEIGAVKPGYLADLLVVDGNPAEDITLTKKISIVIANGRIVA